MDGNYLLFKDIFGWSLIRAYNYDVVGTYIFRPLPLYILRKEIINKSVSNRIFLNLSILKTQVRVYGY